MDSTMQETPGDNVTGCLALFAALVFMVEVCGK